MFMASRSDIEQGGLSAVRVSDKGYLYRLAAFLDKGTDLLVHPHLI